MSPYGVWKGPRVTSGDGPTVAAGEACDAYGTEPGLSSVFTRPWAMGVAAWGGSLRAAYSFVLKSCCLGQVWQWREHI